MIPNAASSSGGVGRGTVECKTGGSTLGKVAFGTTGGVTIGSVGAVSTVFNLLCRSSPCSNSRFSFSSSSAFSATSSSSEPLKIKYFGEIDVQAGGTLATILYVRRSTMRLVANENTDIAPATRNDGIKYIPTAAFGENLNFPLCSLAR